MKYLLVFLLFASTANAEPFKVVFLNTCPDYTDSWDCLNATQGAQCSETLQQVSKALKNTRYKKPITIYSIDPLRPDKDTWEFGAWVRKDKVYFAADPGGCPNARRDLERVLRKLNAKP